jgi:hypothetical protein
MASFIFSGSMIFAKGPKTLATARTQGRKGREENQIERIYLLFAFASLRRACALKRYGAQT